MSGFNDRGNLNIKVAVQISETSSLTQWRHENRILKHCERVKRLVLFIQVTAYEDVRVPGSLSINSTQKYSSTSP